MEVSQESGSAGMRNPGLTCHGSAVSKLLVGSANVEIGFEEKELAKVEDQDFPITFAFITNSSKFVLKDFEGYDIQRHHVDKDGTILDDVGNKEFREMIRGMLLRNVFVKFYFLEQDPN